MRATLNEGPHLCYSEGRWQQHLQRMALPVTSLIGTCSAHLSRSWLLFCINGTARHSTAQHSTAQHSEQRWDQDKKRSGQQQMWQVCPCGLGSVSVRSTCFRDERVCYILSGIVCCIARTQYAGPWCPNVDTGAIISPCARTDPQPAVVLVCG